MRQSSVTVADQSTDSQGTWDGRVEIRPLETLIGVYRSNQRLLELLGRTKRDLERARAYLAQPDCNLALGLARVGQLRERRRKVLRQLEANWMAIRELDAIPQAG